MMKFVWQNLAAMIKFDHLNLRNICMYDYIFYTY
jgi:hypothetical protein